MSDKGFIRLAMPFIDDDEFNEIRSVLTSGYLTQGPKVAEFEQMVAKYVRTKYAFAMSSCTTALHLSLVVLGIGPGDEVLVPDFTFPATANVVIQQGAIPVLVDINIDTFAIDVADAARKITPRTKAIMPVHPFGLSADMDPIMALAQEHNLKVVEDAATAIGATYKDHFCGAIGNLGCFSFHPRKVITTGEGGMITTDDELLAEKIRLLRNHGGIRQDGRSKFMAAGYNYRLSDIQGAVGVAQMRKLEGMISQRRKLAQLLTERLADLGETRPPYEPNGFYHIYQSYVVLLDDGIDRESVINAFEERHIETTLGTYALHTQPFFQSQYGYLDNSLPNSYRAYKQTIALPFYVQMTEDDIGHLSSTLTDIVRKVQMTQL
jgi:dTDP-4-amino-4,6-dideoxygalactose transaminase